jgi:predicted nuclease with TOPRIM domain
MMDPGFIDKLSTSSRHVLQWAEGLAKHRAEKSGYDATSYEVDTFDLFIGMMLEHSQPDSEPNVFLNHFNLIVGQLLPANYSTPTVNELQRQLDHVSVNAEPVLDSEASAVVSNGISIASQYGSTEHVEFRYLYCSLFMQTQPNPFTEALNEVLSERGVSDTNFYAAHEEYLRQYEKDKNYAALLKQRHAYNPAPVDIPNYKTDYSQTNDLTDDLVNIKAEVDAFAYLLASHRLKPPLAVGLFGDWGSGKSFFMQSVQHRIERLTQTPAIKEKPQKEVPFWKRIIQIEFNAWHYVRGELWASLIDHIFNQLRFYEDEKKSAVDERREYWQEQMSSIKTELTNLNKQKEDKTQELNDKQQQVKDLEAERSRKREELEQLRADKIKNFVLKNCLEEVKNSVTPVINYFETESPERVKQQLQDARSELERASTLWRSLWRDPKQTSLTIIAILAVPLVAWIVETIAQSTVVAPAFAGISTAMASGMGLMKNGTDWIREQLDKVSNAEASVQQEIDDYLNKWDTDIENSENAIKDIELQLQANQQESDQLQQQLEQIREELEAVTPAKVLNDFVAERVGSDDYRKLLGLPALIQRDFKKLAKLIREYNADYFEKDEGKETDEKYFNRIILYIDDLDRCPDERVVEVLQAVHLLLAFDLFVVVVAVDARWLNYALIRHFPALAMNTANIKQLLHNTNTDTIQTSKAQINKQATADDYLEKIFQIPFWVQPLVPGAKASMVNGLLRENIVHQGGGEIKKETGDRPSLGKQQQAILPSLNPSSALPGLETANFAITLDELGFLSQLSNIMGETPRSIKRFVNLYQLVRIIYRTTNPLTTSVTAGQPTDEQLIAFLLAIGDGLPVIGPLLMKSIREANKINPDMQLRSVLTDLPSAQQSDERIRLDEWFLGINNWEDIQVTRLANLLPMVERFLFRVGEQLLLESTPPLFSLDEINAEQSQTQSSIEEVEN